MGDKTAANALGKIAQNQIAIHNDVLMLDDIESVNMMKQDIEI